MSFQSDGVTTYGTLEVPPHADGQHLAGALLIAGSGPTDRDGNQPPDLTPDTLKVVADLLAKDGIMTLRYDKYYSGKTGAGPGDAKTEKVDIDLDQADAAYAFLALQPDVDTSKLLVVGHSEGGMIALHIATTATQKPAGLGLLEPQDGRILDILAIQIAEQTQGEVAEGKLTPAQARTSNQAVARAIKQMRAGDLHISSTGMADIAVRILQETVNTSPTYALSWDRIDPTALAAQVSSGTQVLVTDGTRDVNVPPSTIHPLVQALSSAGTTGPGFQLIQGTNHEMHLPSQPDNDAVLAPKVVDALDQWAQPFATH